MLRLVILLCVASTVFGSPLQDIIPHLNGRIVGGEDVDIKDYPYQLSFQLAGTHECGAAIISELWALTAAQCAVGTVSSMSLRAGSSQRGSGGTVYQVDHKVVHDSYSLTTHDYDLALLRVSTPFEFGEGVDSIPLPAQGQPPGLGVRSNVTGWGTTTAGGPAATVLQRAEIPLIGTALCQEAYGVAAVTDRMVCAGKQEGGADFCQGDLGGPMVVKGELVGVVSWGTGCGRPDSPGVYAKVSEMRDWILTNTGI